MNSMFAPRKMRPSETKPTTPTAKFEMGGRARVLAYLIKDGRS